MWLSSNPASLLEEDGMARGIDFEFEDCYGFKPTQKFMYTMRDGHIATQPAKIVPLKQQ